MKRTDSLCNKKSTHCAAAAGAKDTTGSPVKAVIRLFMAMTRISSLWRAANCSLPENIGFPKVFLGLQKDSALQKSV